MYYKFSYLIFAATFILAAPAQLFAEDKVILTADNPEAKNLEITGKIVEFTGKTLQIRLSTGRERTIQTDKVERIEFTQHKYHLAGDRFLEKRLYARALNEFQNAMRGEKRDWVRRRILSQIVWCHRYLNDIEKAGRIYLLIAQNDPTTQYVDSMPLAWQTTQISASLEKKARQWLNADDSPSANLMGASWLLSTGERPAAIKKLQQLSLVSDKRIVQLAYAQLWRTQLAGAENDQIDRRQHSLRQMPTELQAGPWFLVAQALSLQDKPAQAALAYLHIPILHPKDKKLASEALLASSLELEKLDKTKQSRQLLNELLDNFPKTAASKEAEVRLGRLDKK